jgi:hypothetical protein
MSAALFLEKEFQIIRRQRLLNRSNDVAGKDGHLPMKDVAEGENSATADSPKLFNAGPIVFFTVGELGSGAWGAGAWPPVRQTHTGAQVQHKEYAPHEATVCSARCLQQADCWVFSLLWQQWQTTPPWQQPTAAGESLADFPCETCDFS